MITFQAMQKTKPAAPAPIRKIRDRGDGSTLAPVEAEKPVLSPEAKKAILKVLAEREENRMKKNAASSKESAAFKQLEALMLEHGVKGINGVVTIDGVKYDATAKVEAQTKKVIDLDALQRKVKKADWKKCLVAQVGLVEKIAGKNIVNECTKEEPNGEKLEIEITKRPAK